MAIDFKCECGFGISASDSHAGRVAVCGQCGRLLTVPGVTVCGTGTRTSPEESPDNRQSEPESLTLICASCGKKMSAIDGVSCVSCRAVLHLKCWLEKNGCTFPGCPSSKGSRRSFTARGKKPGMRPCPNCDTMVPVSANRCPKCGEFIDRKLREADRKKRVPFPIKTSNLAGISMISGLLGMILIHSFDYQSAIRILILLLPLMAIGFGCWALRDIRAAEGEKSGHWTAGFGIGMGVLTTITWLLNLL